MPLTDTQKARIKKTFANFLDKRAKNLEKLTLDDLKFNVVALRTTAPMLDFGSAEDLLRYRLARGLMWIATASSRAMRCRSLHVVRETE